MNILLTPKTEWLVIRSEVATVRELFVGYVFPLSFLHAAASLFSGLFWSITSGLVGGIVTLVTTAITFILGSYITDALAPYFSSEKNLNRSAQLIAYSSTASIIASILGRLPFIGAIILIGGLGYTCYLVYLGTIPVKETPPEKRVGYVIMIIIVQMALNIVLTALLATILLPRFPHLGVI